MNVILIWRELVMREPNNFLYESDIILIRIYSWIIMKLVLSLNYTQTHTHIHTSYTNTNPRWRTSTSSRASPGKSAVLLVWAVKGAWRWARPTQWRLWDGMNVDKVERTAWWTTSVTINHHLTLAGQLCQMNRSLYALRRSQQCRVTSTRKPQLFPLPYRRRRRGRIPH